MDASGTLVVIDLMFFFVGKALPEYSRTRNPDAEAIVDLAMYNYIEVYTVYSVYTVYFLRLVTKS